jgi:DNA-binding protein HU-beta
MGNGSVFLRSQAASGRYAVPDNTRGRDRRTGGPGRAAARRPAPMNKGELIELVATELESSKADAGRAVEAVLECITKGVKKESKVALAGFGTFTKRKRAARTGINPITKAQMKIPASTTCGFKPAAALKESL